MVDALECEELVFENVVSHIGKEKATEEGNEVPCLRMQSTTIPFYVGCQSYYICFVLLCLR